MTDEHGIDGGLMPPEEPRKSKTRRKKEMIELQKLGERLVVLPDGYLRRSGIPEDLLEAVLALKKISSFGARKRQKQYIGAIMREVDSDRIIRVIEGFGQVPGNPGADGEDPMRRKQ